MLTHKEISKLFSSKRILEICNGDFTFLKKVATNYQSNLSNPYTPQEVYEVCYKDLSRNYRGEYFFKNTVTEKILLGRHSTNTATAISEFRVGKSKADCVIVNGSSTCYEIKSEYDNLDRLDNQLHNYQKLFDKVYIVTSENHIEHIEKKVSPEIGIILLTKRNSLSQIREAKSNENEIDVPTLIRSLRVGEYTEIVKLIYGSIPNCSNTEIFDTCEKLLRQAPPVRVRNFFCKVIKKSRSIENNFINNLPRALLTAGISYKFSKNQKIALLENLKQNISKDALCTTQYLEASNLN
ncbi:MULTISPECIES: sce7726 family protein [Pseudomonas]|uniref:sce7726 family protein n=2 Tax=Pseudomonas TaxID=286 RepID=UPI00111C7008|nr:MULTISPECIES: sce7726 family protein [Pseudomonas]UIN57069.1 sce7726 family protein [Pseudomonas kribbensis]